MPVKVIKSYANKLGESVVFDVPKAVLAKVIYLGNITLLNKIEEWSSEHTESIPPWEWRIFLSQLRNDYVAKN